MSASASLRLSGSDAVRRRTYCQLQRIAGLVAGHILTHPHKFTVQYRYVTAGAGSSVIFAESQRRPYPVLNQVS